MKMKKAVIAPDSFKGTMTSVEVCEIIKDELEKKYPNIECVTLPVADGGEGTVDAFLYALGGQKIEVDTTDPIGRKIKACYALINGDTAIIETAAASGLTLLEKKDATGATTYGTGVLALDALSRGIRRLVIGLGGSATTDGGTGFLTALGIKFTTPDKKSVITGGELLSISDISVEGLDERIKECEITALCDVTNPLYGENGAAYIFSKQKGADEQQLELLDMGLRHLSRLSAQALGFDKSNTEGAGAAGGLGFALLSYLSAKFESGAEAVLRICGFDEKIKGADIVITGEGKMDTQSLCGKVPFSVAKKSVGVPVKAIVGVSEISADEAKRHGISEIIETNPQRLELDEVKKQCRGQLRAAAKKI